MIKACIVFNILYFNTKYPPSWLPICVPKLAVQLTRDPIARSRCVGALFFLDIIKIFLLSSAFGRAHPDLLGECFATIRKCVFPSFTFILKSATLNLLTSAFVCVTQIASCPAFFFASKEWEGIPEWLPVNSLFTLFICSRMIARQHFIASQLTFLTCLSCQILMMKLMRHNTKVKLLS